MYLVAHRVLRWSLDQLLPVLEDLWLRAKGTEQANQWVGAALSAPKGCEWTRHSIPYPTITIYTHIDKHPTIPTITMIFYNYYQVLQWYTMIIIPTFGLLLLLLGVSDLLGQTTYPPAGRSIVCFVTFREPRWPSKRWNKSITVAWWYFGCITGEAGNFHQEKWEFKYIQLYT
jgi:hypothetical protein